jgi:hypothetical protein
VATIAYTTQKIPLKMAIEYHAPNLEICDMGVQCGDRSLQCSVGDSEGCTTMPFGMQGHLIE